MAWAKEESMKLSKWVVLASVLMISIAGCQNKDLYSDCASAAKYRKKGPMVLAAYQAWHGLPSHSLAFSGEPMLPNNRPYDSRDPEVISRHIREAKKRGIGGFVVNWYGPKAGVANDEDREFQDQATAELYSQAEAKNFHIALLYDEGTVSSTETDPALFTARVKSDLEYAEKYLASPANLVIDQRPALFIFDYGNVDPYLDWADIRAHVSIPVTLITKDPNPLDPAYDAQFDGFYAWVYATNGQWHPDGLEWGQEYMEWFYATMQWGVYADKVAVGGVWPGFDDTLAPWGQNRYMTRSGTTLHETLLTMAENGNVDYIMVGTWNDFEEGTDIEYGVCMLVDMEKPDPELLIRSTPVIVYWDCEIGDAVLQVYKSGQLLYDQEQSPGICMSLSPGAIYELKLWIPGSPTPLAKWIKIRRSDPIPDVEPIVVD